LAEEDSSAGNSPGMEDDNDDEVPDILIDEVGLFLK